MSDPCCLLSSQWLWAASSWLSLLKRDTLGSAHHWPSAPSQISSVSRRCRSPPLSRTFQGLVVYSTDPLGDGPSRRLCLLLSWFCVVTLPCSQNRWPVFVKESLLVINWKSPAVSKAERFLGVKYLVRWGAADLGHAWNQELCFSARSCAGFALSGSLTLRDSQPEWLHL